MADNPITSHLNEVGESYGEHFVHAGSFGLTMIAGGLACLVHGLFPFLFANTGSNTIRRLHGRMTKRVDAPNWERHPII